MNIHPLLIGIFSIVIVSMETLLALYHPDNMWLRTILWSGSILLCIALPFRFPTKLQIKKSIRQWQTYLVIAALLLPLVVRVANYQPNRIHGDDIITATFSKQYDVLHDNFFAGVPHDKVQWVSQFPSLYFVLQHFFFAVFGANLLTIKLSVLPYIFLVVLETYRLTKRLTNRFTAVVTVILLAFFPMSIYLETLGIHVVASTAMFMLFFDALTLALDTQNTALFLAAGVWCGLSYMFYGSSYIAFPILGFMLLVYLVKKHSTPALLRTAVAIFGFLIVMAPYLVYIKYTENYFTGRLSQVSLIGGQWSSLKNVPVFSKKTANTIRESFINSSKALVYDGIGGAGGYTFGNLAFFPPSLLVLFICGALIGLILGLRRFTWILMIGITVGVFITGVVLSIPPPSYYRLAIVFPFIVMLSALPFMVLYTYVHKPWVVALTAFVLLCTSVTGETYFQKSVTSEAMDENIKASRFINTTYPGRHIHVASYPGYMFEKTYDFVEGKTSLSIDTDYHGNYLRDWKDGESYVYVMTFPTEFNAQFEAKDPNGKAFPFNNSYGMFVN
jgi:hypothetical protein